MDYASRPTTALLADAAAAAIASDPDDRGLWDLIYALQERATPRRVRGRRGVVPVSRARRCARLGVEVLGELGLDASFPVRPRVRARAAVAAAGCRDDGGRGSGAGARHAGRRRHRDVVPRGQPPRSRRPRRRRAQPLRPGGPGRDPDADRAHPRPRGRRAPAGHAPGWAASIARTRRTCGSHSSSGWSDTDSETREEAIFALAQLGDDRVDAALRGRARGAGDQRA